MERTDTYQSGPSQYSKSIRHVAPLLIVFFSETFFAVYAVLGLTYEGSETSSSYHVYIAVIVTVTVLSALRSILAGGLNLGHFFLMFLVGAVVILFLLNVALGGAEAQSGNSFRLWIFLGIPALLAGIAASKTDQLKNASLLFEPLMLLFSAAAFVYAIGNFTSGVDVTGLGGATYQTASYLSALAFGINTYHLLFGDNHRRWAFTKTRSYILLSMSLLPLQVASCLLTGGRGGFVLILVYVIVLTAVAIIHSGISRIGLGLAALTFGTVAIFAIAPTLLNNEFGSRVLGRVFSYVGAEGINWDGTSGRGNMYEEALLAIREAPVAGYGLFSWGMDGYPHNFFLEVLLNGGLLYLACWMVGLLFLVLKLRQRIRIEPATLILVAVGLFPFVMLMFSGSYWSTTSFWYILGAGLSWQSHYGKTPQGVARRKRITRPSGRRLPAHYDVN